MQTLQQSLKTSRSLQMKLKIFTCDENSFGSCMLGVAAAAPL